MHGYIMALKGAPLSSGFSADGSLVSASAVSHCDVGTSQNDRGLLRVIVITRGWNGYRIRVSTVS